MYQCLMWVLLQNINYAKENKTMKLQKQIILDNVDKVKAFVMTVSKYPGDATLVSGRYVVGQSYCFFPYLQMTGTFKTA